MTPVDEVRLLTAELKRLRRQRKRATDRAARERLRGQMLRVIVELYRRVGITGAQAAGQEAQP